MTIGKTIALTRWTFVGKVMSLLFNMLSRLVKTFLPRSNVFYFIFFFLGNTKLTFNTSYRLTYKWDTGLYKIWLIIVKETVTMTMTGPCEMSGLSSKFSGVGSKFLCFIYVSQFRPNLFIEDDSRRRRVSFHCQASEEVLCHGDVSM